MDTQVIVDMDRLEADDGYRVAACAWAEANGLDPNLISAAAPITLDPDGRTLRYRAWKTARDRRLLTPRAGTEERTADMRVPFTS